MAKGKKGGGGGGGGKGGKNLQKEKQKIVEDKTFGLKNKKKSAKVQKYVQRVEKQVDDRIAKKTGYKPGSKPQKRTEDEDKFDPLFKAVTTKKNTVDAGVDPKSVLCQYFKAGHCRRGKACKFSHDLAVERKAEKIDIYTDPRDLDENRSRKENETAVVCKHFLEAVKAKKYGWFWTCPNDGNACPYRHALPEGYDLEDNGIEEEDSTPIEELIDEERTKLTTHTPLTLELFLAWKEKKRLEEEEKNEVSSKKRAADIKAGRIGMSGRELFSHNASLFVDDDSALDEYEEEDTLPANVPRNVIEVTATSVVLKPISNTTKKDGRVDVFGVLVDDSLFVDDPSLPNLNKEEEA